MYIFNPLEKVTWSRHIYTSEDLSYAWIIEESDKLFIDIWNETVWEMLTFLVVPSIHELPTK